MKTRLFIFTLATALMGMLAFSVGVLAAPRLCDDGTRPPCDGGGGGNEVPDFGDLIILLRTDSGVPIPSPETQVEDPETGLLVDGGLCWQPIAFNIDDETLCPADCQVATTPATVDVNQFNCGVAAGCSGCTQEVDFGRTNEARSPDDVFEAQLEDVVIKLATADCRTLDPAGRLVASTVRTVVIDDVEVDEVSTSTIDSPLQNLAIYRQLMLTGDIGAPLPEGVGTLDTAARGLGVASDKAGEINMDQVAYVNFLMGLSDPETTTILDPKLCEWYREEVQGEIELVKKCYLDYGAYGYDRTTNFGALPAPAYIPADDPDTEEIESEEGWFEYTVLLTEDPPTFGIEYGPILDAVFPDGLGGVDPGFEGGNIGGFAQASDDTRAVINFMHENPVQVDFVTPVPCIADPNLIAYDVLISDVSGLQVPARMVDGSEGREFFLTITNASSSTDSATGNVTVTAVETNGTPIEGSPWGFEFTDLAPGASEQWTTFFTIDLGHSTTITWTAVAFAPDDMNLSNNTVTATTSVKVTGGGGGGKP